MLKIDKIVSKNTRSRPLEAIKKSFKVEKNIQLKWTSIFGKLAKKLSFSHLKGPTLVVNTSNPIWVNEIKFYEEKIIKKITELIPKSTVKYIKIEHKKEKKEKDKIIKNTGRNLEEKIKNENKRKKKLGYKSCEKCGQLWPSGKECLFC